MNTQEFAQTIKAKYPQYKGVDDATLVSKIVEKYPVYKSQISDMATDTVEQPQQGFIPKVTDALKSRVQNITDINSQRSEGQSVAGEVLNAISPKAAETAGPVISTIQKVKQATGIGGGADIAQIGQAAGAINDVIGETLSAIVPEKIKEWGAEKAKKLAETALGQAGIDTIDKYNEFAQKYPLAAKNIEGAVNVASLFGIETGAEAGASAGIKAAKSGVAAIDNATAGVVDTSKNLIGDAVEKTGQKIQNSVIKPSTRDIKDGFKIENINKYDVGGSLPETVAKTHVKMNELSNQLMERLKGSSEKIDLLKTFNETAKRLIGDKTKTFGDNSAIERVLKQLKGEITNASDNGKVDLVQATNVKRGAGTKGAWAYNRPEADASAIEKVYSEFYDVIKNDIEKAAPEGVKDINKQLSELIPISNAALRRLTVEERNNILSLTENIGLLGSILDPRAIAIYGISKASRSGRVGNALSKIGKRIRE